MLVMRWFGLAAVALSLGSCALQSPLTTEAAAKLNGRRLTTVVRRSTPFLVSKAHMAPDLASPIGGVIAASDIGERLVRENAIADPAFTIARELDDELRRRYGLRQSPTLLAAVDDDPTRIGSLDAASDLVLDVWTDHWEMGRFDNDDPGYVVTYQVNLRLIDAKVVRAIDGKSGAVIAEGTCVRNSEEAPGRPTRDGLLADHARRLKDELDAATRFCINDLSVKILLDR